MGHPLRIVEGNVTDRTLGPLGNFVTDGPQVTAVDVLFDFGGLRKDIHIENDKPVTVKFDSASNTGMTIAAGSWDWTGEFAAKAFVTFTMTTNFRMFANG